MSEEFSTFSGPPMIPHASPKRKRRRRGKKKSSQPQALPPIRNPTPLHRLQGPESLVASDLPEGFPPELAYRALAAYSLLRTLSIQLRLSPFTPNVFLRALMLPYPDRLLGQVHVALLRVLLPHLHHGYTYRDRGGGVCVAKRRRVDGVWWDLRGGDNLTYLDGLTWPLFYDDYVHLTADHLWALMNDTKLHFDSNSVAFDTMQPVEYAAERQDERHARSDKGNTAPPIVSFPGSALRRKGMVLPSRTGHPVIGSQHAYASPLKSRRTRMMEQISPQSEETESEDDAALDSASEFEDDNDEDDDDDEEYGAKPRKRPRGRPRGRPPTALHKTVRPTTAPMNTVPLANARPVNVPPAKVPPVMPAGRPDAKRNHPEQVAHPSQPPGSHSNAPPAKRMKGPQAHPPPPYYWQGQAYYPPYPHHYPYPYAHPLPHGPVMPPPPSQAETGNSDQGEQPLGTQSMPGSVPTNPCEPSATQLGQPPKSTPASAVGNPYPYPYGYAYPLPQGTVMPPPPPPPPRSQTEAGSSDQGKESLVGTQSKPGSIPTKPRQPNAAMPLAPSQTEPKSGQVKEYVGAQPKPKSVSIHPSEPSVAMPPTSQEEAQSGQGKESLGIQAKPGFIPKNPRQPNVTMPPAPSQAEPKSDKEKESLGTQSKPKSVPIYPREPSAAMPPTSQEEAKPGQENEYVGAQPKPESATTIPHQPGAAMRLAPSQTEPKSGQRNESVGAQPKPKSVSIHPREPSGTMPPPSQTETKSNQGKESLGAQSSKPGSVRVPSKPLSTPTSGELPKQEEMTPKIWNGSMFPGYAPFASRPHSVPGPQPSTSAGKAPEAGAVSRVPSTKVQVKSQKVTVKRPAELPRLEPVTQNTRAYAVASDCANLIQKFVRGGGNEREGPLKPQSVGKDDEKAAKVQERLGQSDTSFVDSKPVKNEAKAAFPPAPDEWPQFTPIKAMRDGIPYHRLPLEEKLRMLEFLIDELLAVDSISLEFTKRQHTLGCCSSPYGALPSKEELDSLVNQDECGICGVAGDLLCCDGCVRSFHRTCIGMATGAPLPEGKWLCLDCANVDCTRYGTLRGGQKPLLEWFALSDLQAPGISSHTSGGDGLNHQADTSQGNVAGSLSSQEFLVVHGFVFTRPALDDDESHGSPDGLNYVPPRYVPVSQNELYRLLQRIGPSTSSKWPLSQIPMDPSKLWANVNEPERTTKMTRYFTLRESFDPSFYLSRYRLAPIPSPMHAKGSKKMPLLLSNYESECCAPFVQALTEALSRDMSRDVAISNSLVSSTVLFNPYAMISTYLIALETSLRRGCLLDENWAIRNGVRDPQHWHQEVRQCRSIKVLATKLVNLIDSCHSRVFMEGWSGLAATAIGSKKDMRDTGSSAESGDVPLYKTLSDDWTPEGEMTRRRWQRARDSNMLTLLSRESYRLDGSTTRTDESVATKQGRKKRKNDTTIRTESFAQKTAESEPDKLPTVDKNSAVSDAGPLIVGNPLSEAATVQLPSSTNGSYSPSSERRSESHHSYGNSNQQEAVTLPVPCSKTNGVTVEDGKSPSGKALSELDNPLMEKSHTTMAVDGVEVDSAGLFKPRGSAIAESSSAKRVDPDEAAPSAAPVQEVDDGPERKQNDSVLNANMEKDRAPSKELEITEPPKASSETSTPKPPLTAPTKRSGAQEDPCPESSSHASLMTGTTVASKSLQDHQAAEQTAANDSSHISAVKQSSESAMSMGNESKNGTQEGSAPEKVAGSLLGTTANEPVATQETEEKADHSNGKVDEPATSLKSEDLPQKKAPKRKKRPKKKTTTARAATRRSGRSHHLHYEENADGTLYDESTPLDQAAAIGNERKERLNQLEQLASPPWEKELHWPLAGRKLFDPVGYLPRSEMRRLGRNAGLVAAPFVRYTAYEVGEASVYHAWRRRLLKTNSFEDLIVQIRVLCSFLDKQALQSCESLARRTPKAKSYVYNRVVCRQRDLKTGTMHYFVVNESRGRRKGAWVTSGSIDLSALILDRSMCIDKKLEKLAMRAQEKMPSAMSVPAALPKVDEQLAKRQRMEAAALSLRVAAAYSSPAEPPMQVSRNAAQSYVEGSSTLSIAARLALAAARTPEMDRVIEQHEAETCRLIVRCREFGASSIPPAEMGRLRLESVLRMNEALAPLARFGSRPLSESSILALLADAEKAALDKMENLQSFHQRHSATSPLGFGGLTNVLSGSQGTQISPLSSVRSETAMNTNQRRYDNQRLSEQNGLAGAHLRTEDTNGTPSPVMNGDPGRGQPVAPQNHSSMSAYAGTPSVNQTQFMGSNMGPWMGSAYAQAPAYQSAVPPQQLQANPSPQMFQYQSQQFVPPQPVQQSLQQQVSSSFRPPSSSVAHPAERNPFLDQTRKGNPRCYNGN